MRYLRAVWLIACKDLGSETRHFERQFGGRNVHSHAADDDRHQFLLAEAQAAVLYAKAEGENIRRRAMDDIDNAPERGTFR